MSSISLQTSVIRETSLASQYLQSQQPSQFKQAIGLVNGPQDLKVYSLKQVRAVCYNKIRRDFDSKK